MLVYFMYFAVQSSCSFLHKTTVQLDTILWIYQVHTLDNGDHSLRVRGSNFNESVCGIIDAVVRFVNEISRTYVQEPLPQRSVQEEAFLTRNILTPGRRKLKRKLVDIDPNQPKVKRPSRATRSI